MPSDLIIQITGIIPAIIFPTASLIQLVALLRRRNAEGVSALSWFCFGFANICLYIYTQKYGEWEAIVTFLGTSTLNFSVCILALYYQRKTKKPQTNAFFICSFFSFQTLVRDSIRQSIDFSLPSK